MIHIIIFALVALIIILLVLWLPFINKHNEHYNHGVIGFPYHQYNNKYEQQYDPYFDTHTNFPFWNSQLGSKRGMSYDLRGDVPIPYSMQFPFNMGTRTPIINKPLYLAS